GTLAHGRGFVLFRAGSAGSAPPQPGRVAGSVVEGAVPPPATRATKKPPIRPTSTSTTTTTSTQLVRRGGTGAVRGVTRPDSGRPAPDAGVGPEVEGRGALPLELRAIGLVVTMVETWVYDAGAADVAALGGSGEGVHADGDDADQRHHEDDDGEHWSLPGP